jgi:hypothetical protein
MLLDDDLWVVDPALRFGFTPEEAVEEWRQAADFASALAEGSTGMSGSGLVSQATSQLLWDMRDRGKRSLATCQVAGWSVGKPSGPGYPSIRSPGRLTCPYSKS